MAELILELRGREIRRVPIVRTETTIGRDAAADVSIDNVGVSRVHARLRYDGERFVIQDEGSRNGITVNGVSTAGAALNDGDVIGVNKFELRFTSQGGIAVDELRPPERGQRRSPRDVFKTVTLEAKSVGRMYGKNAGRKESRQTMSMPPAATSWVSRWLGWALVVSIAAGALVYVLTR